MAALLSLLLSVMAQLTNMIQHIVLGTYNCIGLLNCLKRKFVSNILSDFLYLQELWMSDS
jgi:hypothetical protein